VGSRDFFRLLHFELRGPCVVVGSRARSGSFCARSSIPPCSGRAVVAWCSAQGVTLRHPHKIHIGEGTVIDDHVLLDAKGVANQGITHRRARLHRPQHHPLLQGRRHRPRQPHQHRLQLRGVLVVAGGGRGLWPLCRVHLRGRRRARSLRPRCGDDRPAASVERSHHRPQRVAGGGREGPRRGHPRVRTWWWERARW
jgi:hypothetical protein